MKPLTALQLYTFLHELIEEGNDLEKITILYRYDRDSDEQIVYEVEQDLYDMETNSILETIMFLTDPSEK
jgi:hypothetical protein